MASCSVSSSTGLRLGAAAVWLERGAALRAGAGASRGGLLEGDAPPPSRDDSVSSAVANDNITRWNKRELPAMAVHANSASHGLNLQYGGHHICHLALPWGLDPYKQLNERIDRRGQTHLVYGHHIVARDSKDQDVSQALMDKDVEQNRLIAAIRKL